MLVKRWQDTPRELILAQKKYQVARESLTQVCLIIAIGVALYIFFDHYIRIYLTIIYYLYIYFLITSVALYIYFLTIFDFLDIWKPYI